MVIPKPNLEKTLLKVSLILTSSPTRGMDPGVRGHGVNDNHLW